MLKNNGKRLATFPFRGLRMFLNLCGILRTQWRLWKKSQKTVGNKGTKSTKGKTIFINPSDLMSLTDSLSLLQVKVNTLSEGETAIIPTCC